MRNMKTGLGQQSGFTLIELVAVLVLLGILAASAIPKFIDLQDEAQQAAVDSVAGSIESASALNYAIDLAEDAGLTTSDNPVDVADCNDGGDLLIAGLPTGYTIASSAATPAGTVNSGCVLTYTVNSNALTAGFTIIGATDD